MMINLPYILKSIDPSWDSLIRTALVQMNPAYLNLLFMQSNRWIPHLAHLFNAFSLPLHQVHYVLFGESPYPRQESANGYAFWDAAVSNLWSNTGLSKTVNRATSLRNMIKMLLIADESLSSTNTTQSAILALNKQHFVSSNTMLFANFICQGFLLLNTSLIYEPNLTHSHSLRYHIQQWKPFMQSIVHHLLAIRPQTVFLLWGRFAHSMASWVPHSQQLCAEHPYNLSFIHNNAILNFFKPLHLLRHSF